jgi:hypothetical protein
VTRRVRFHQRVSLMKTEANKQTTQFHT